MKKFSSYNTVCTRTCFIHNFTSLNGMYHLMTKCPQKCNMHFRRADVIYKMLATPPWKPLHMHFKNDKVSSTTPKGKFQHLTLTYTKIHNDMLSRYNSHENPIKLLHSTDLMHMARTGRRASCLEYYRCDWRVSK